MNEKNSIHSKVRKIGPILKIEGGLILKYPFKSKPLKGYDDNTVFTNSEPFLNSISNIASDWFKKFPDCCVTHRQIFKLEKFNKEDYEFIPSQILNNVKYFAFSLEKFINTEY